jgi:hypothetical protein
VENDDIIILSFVIFYSHLVNSMAIGFVVAIWYNFHRFGIVCQEKSGNPGGSDLLSIAHTSNDVTGKRFTVLPSGLPDFP